SLNAISHILSSKYPSSESESSTSTSPTSTIALLTAITTLTAYISLYVQSSPPMYYTYVSFPIFFWYRVFQTSRQWFKSSQNQRSLIEILGSFNLSQPILQSTTAILGLIFMVVSPHPS